MVVTWTVPARRASELDAQLAARRQIYLTAERTLRVLEVRDDDADQPPALVVDRHARPASAFSARMTMDRSSSGAENSPGLSLLSPGSFGRVSAPPIVLREHEKDQQECGF
jgi:hypothetical protein